MAGNIAAADRCQAECETIGEDYPVDAPAESISDVWACPIALPRPDGSDLAKALRAEVDLLMPWYAEARRARGRSAFMNSGASEDQLDSVVNFVLAMAEGSDLRSIPKDLEPVGWRQEMPILIRHVCQDLRSFYEWAALARPGAELPNHAALNSWIYKETALGKALLAIGQAVTEDPDPRFTVLRFYIVPEGFWPGERTFGTPPPGTEPLDFAIQANAFLAGKVD